MKLFKTAIVISIVVLGAATAWGQLGLYGSPQVVAMPQAGAGGYGSYYGSPAAPPPPAAPAGHYVSVGQPLPRPMIHTAATDFYPSLPPEPTPRDMPLANARPPQPATPAIGTSMVDQMLREAADTAQTSPDVGYGAASGPYPSTGCEPPCSAESALCGGGRVFSQGCCPWYGSLSALVLGRDRPDRLWTTYESIDPTRQRILEVPFEWRWGGEVRLGRRLVLTPGDSLRCRVRGA